MNITSEYPEFLIKAADNESAHEFAVENDFNENNWFRLPSTLDDAVEAYKKEITPILSKEEWSLLSEEDYKNKSLVGFTNDRILFAKDFFTASKYASKRNWSLHSWKFIQDIELDEVIEYGFYC